MKYKITDGQWIWNPNLSDDKKYDESDLITMKARGDYLINVIDKIPDKASSKDISSLPKTGKFIITWGCSSGKTTALRQFFFENSKRYNLLAVPTISDVNAFYYDMKCMYLVKTTFDYTPTSKILKFHTNCNPSAKELQSANLIICTHERLLIEPPSLLYRISSPVLNSLLKVPGLDLNFRENIFIDEMPNFYKKLKITQDLILSLGSLAEKSVNNHPNDYAQAVLDRTEFMESVANKLLYNQDTSGRQLITTDLAYGTSVLQVMSNSNISLNTKNAEYSEVINKFLFFSNFIMDEFNKRFKDGVSFNELINSYIYYTLGNIEVPSIKVFDGTGDLIIKNSPIWTIINNPKYPRDLKLNKMPIKLDNTSVVRTLKSQLDISFIEYDLDKFIQAIRKVLSEVDGKVLVYTWKSIKLTEEYKIKVESSVVKDYQDIVWDSVVDNLPEYIRSNLTTDENDRVEIIYYKSGEDRVTSKYSDCDTILILGKFFIPNKAISDYNKVNQSDITSEDYTLSLLIQAIYRTSARHKKPITIYYSDDYDNNLINKLLFNFTSVTINDIKYTQTPEYLEYIILNSDFTSRNEKYHKFLIDNLSKIINSQELEVPTEERVSKFKSGINTFCNKIGLNYQNIFNTSKFKIIIN